MNYIKLFLLSLLFYKCRDSSKIDLHLNQDFTQDMIIEMIMDGKTDSLYMKAETQIQLSKTGNDLYEYAFDLQKYYSYSSYKDDVTIVDSENMKPIGMAPLFENTILMKTDKRSRILEEYTFENQNKIPATASIFNFDLLNINFPEFGVSTGSKWGYKRDNYFKDGSKEFNFRVQKITSEFISLIIEVETEGAFKFNQYKGVGTCVLNRKTLQTQKLFLTIDMGSDRKQIYRIREK